MATEIKLPILGENVDSGTVVKVLVSVGDSVTADQPVVDLETDKASVEVPASASGTVKEIRVKEGDTIKVGQVLLTLEDAPRERDGAQPEGEKEVDERAEAQEPKTEPEPDPAQRKRDSAQPQEIQRKRDSAQPQQTP